ncbi:glycosyltransferase family 4 protein [Klebsiella michiganensis]|uniref:glycosyltransferase n=1 Tax=Klebsiella michiganensis TaxID=1134687 RepID=UPI00197F13F6|nr:glycosyltransferase [Klebsiella michiganensis]MBN4044404.1 glycosyltransferase family 4 protein [Klebsiella michiganensis]MEB6369380.1 glycosyltransferase [Klebsiella michiganensis]UXO80575.1 glycosyltransferase [Klebsiella michiganensis]
MKRLLFVTTVLKDESDGIWKKIKYILYAYSNAGYLIDIVYRTKNGYVLEREFETNESNVLMVGETHKDLLFYYLAKIVDRSYDILYVRKPFGGASFILLFLLVNTIKKNNPKFKFVFEIPTYPYKNEIKIFKHKVSECLFGLSKYLYLKKIDAIIYMGKGGEKIWGRPSLKIENGIDPQHVPLLKEKLNTNFSDGFVLLGVARLSFWHGYDRMIESISNYKGKVNIKLLIVGDGEPEFTRLRNLVSEKNISEKVMFFGSLSGSELDRLYLESHVCIDSLGRHRSGNLYNSSLKSKEYTAKGIPFIKSHIDESFNGCDFIYNVAPDESEIDIANIVNWYCSLPVNTPVNMRKFAESNLTWELQCSKVISFLYKV